jgi:hypothetical protein
MFEAPRLAVMIAFALMTVGVMWACVQGGSARVAAVPGTGAEETALPDALRVVLREATVSNGADSETDGIVPFAAMPAGTHGMMMQVIAMPVHVIGALRRPDPLPRAAAPRGPPAV